MKHVRSFRGFLFVGVAIVALGVAMLAAPVSAASTASLTIHARLCPNGQPTTDIFTNCHGHKAEAGTAFRVDSGASQFINSSGNITFTKLSTTGTHVVRRTAGEGPNEFLKERVFCSWKNGTSAELSPSSNGNFVVSLSGGSATCDVYLIPESAS